MRQEKGQVPIIILIIFIIGIVIYINFFKPSLKMTPSTVPNSPGQTTVSPKPESPPANPPSSYSAPVPDNSSPFRSNPQPSGGVGASTREIFISLNTDENATCRYATVSGVFYEYMQNTFSQTGGTFHQTLITALSEGGVYNYYVRCVDGQGNKNSNDFVISFWVNYPADFTAPVLSNAYPTGSTLTAGTFETMIGVSTNEPAICRYSWVQGVGYDSMGGNLSSDGTQKYHTATITGLATGNAYNYFIRCKDYSGNANTGDVMVSFQVAY